MRFKMGCCTHSHFFVEFIFVFIAEVGKNETTWMPTTPHASNSDRETVSTSISPIKTAEIISGVIRFLFITIHFKYGDWLGFQHHRSTHYSNVCLRFFHFTLLTVSENVNLLKLSLEMHAYRLIVFSLSSNCYEVRCCFFCCCWCCWK